MEAFLIPLEFGKCLAFGEEGRELKGPVLYVPKRGAIFYVSSVMGDAESSGMVPVAADYFGSYEGDLEILDKQIKGEKLEPPYDTERFDLSKGVIKVDISETKFQDIANKAETGYRAIAGMRHMSMELITGLEARLGHERVSPQTK